MARKSEKTDPLGLHLDDHNISEIPPSIVIYGQPGSGKSTEIAKAFSDCLWICSNETVLRPYATWCWKNPVEVMKYSLRTPDQPDPKDPTGYKHVNRPWEDGGMARKTIGEYLPGTEIAINSWKDLDAIVKRYVEACKNGTCPYNGIIFDEWSTFADRIYAEMLTHYGTSGRGMFTAIAEIKSFHKKVQSLPARTGRMMALVCHDSPLKLEENEKSPSFGKQKYLGGPKLPIGSLIKQVTATADIVLQVELIVVGQTTLRRYATEAHPKWERKFRDFSIRPNENLDLRPLLLRAGYNLGAIAPEELEKLIQAREEPPAVAATVDL